MPPRVDVKYTVPATLPSVASCDAISRTTMGSDHAEAQEGR